MYQREKHSSRVFFVLSFFNANNWNAIFLVKNVCDGKYLLSMFLTDNRSHWEAHKKFAKEKRLKHICYIKGNAMNIDFITDLLRKNSYGLVYRRFDDSKVREIMDKEFTWISTKKELTHCLKLYMEEIGNQRRIRSYNIEGDMIVVDFLK